MKRLSDTPLRKYCRRGVDLAMFVLLSLGTAVAQTTYRVTDLGTLGGTFSLGWGVNNKGWVSGFSTLSGDQNTHATLWINGLKIDLGTLGGPNSLGLLGPAERGWAAGIAETSTLDPNGEDECGFGTHLICLPFLWQNGVMTALPTLGGNNGEAFAVNNRGQVAGVAETGVPDPTCTPPAVLGFEPVLWENGQVQQQLPTVSGDPDGFATAINDNGQAVGATANCSEIFQGLRRHAVLWESGTPTDLGSFGGTMNNQALNLNDRAQVVGYSGLPGDITYHAFLWQNGVMTDLGTLPGDFSSLTQGINNEGEAVGQSCDASGNCRAFLWQDGVMTDLNALTPADSPLYTLAAFEINASGQITGFGLQASTGEVHAFLATPVPEEASGAAAPAARGESRQRPRVTLPESVPKLLQRRLGFGGFGIALRGSR
jgi:probable HAF family extracellular repeat protein